MISALVEAMARSAIGMSFLAVLFVATASILDLNPVQDGLTDDVISPSCRIGSLQSWQGQPCVIFERERFGQQDGR